MPSMWLLTDGRRGDLAQLRRLAELTGWTTLEKQLHVRLPTLAKPPALSRLLVDHARSDPLEPPWPDVVAFAEARVQGPALTVKKRSGGRTKVMAVGRPVGDPACCDLILTTAQYGLAPAPHVLELPLPLTGYVRPSEADAASLAQVLAAAPRPWTALLVGGSAPPDRLDVAAARRMAEDITAWHASHGGSLLALTSPRTDPAAAEVLHAGLPRAALFHRWAPEGPNPYAAVLACADCVIVSSDSISMAAEASALGKPVSVYALPQTPGWDGRLLAALAAPGPLTALMKPLFDAGILEARADRRRFFARLAGSQQLAYWPDMPDPPRGSLMHEAEQAALRRMRALLMS
jgi:uncharacterized protein